MLKARRVARVQVTAERKAVLGLKALSMPEMLSGKEHQFRLIRELSRRLNASQNKTERQEIFHVASACNIFNRLRDCYSLNPGNKIMLDAFRALGRDLSGDNTQKLSRLITGKLVVVHVSCEKYIQEATASARSFDTAPSHEVHLLVTGNAQRVKFWKASPSFKLEGTRLHIDAPDNYEGHCTKVMLLYLLLHLFGPPRMVLKLDDDVRMLNRYRFDQLCRVLDSECVDYAGDTIRPNTNSFYHGWHIGKTEERRFDNYGQQYPLPTQFAKGGDGYFVSSKGLAVLAESYLSRRAFYSASPMLEDIIVGLVMQVQGVPLLNLDLVGAGINTDIKPVFSLTNQSMTDYDHIRRLHRSSLRHRSQEAALFHRRVETLLNKSRPLGDSL